MRVGAVALLVIVGCTSSERATRSEPTPKVGDMPSPSAGNPMSSQPPSAIDAGSDATFAPTSPQNWDAGLIPFFLDPFGAACPFPASTCSGDCVPVTGILPDDASHCLSPVVVGCVPEKRDWITNGETVPNCFRRLDGIILVTGILYLNHLGPDWKVCNRDDRDLTSNMPACP